MIDHDTEIASLRQAELNFRILFDTLDQLLVVMDTQGNILRANHQMCATLGYTADELARLNIRQIHPPQRAAEVSQIIAGVMAGQQRSCPVPLQTRDGRVLPMETRLLIGQWDGRPALIGLCRDQSDLQASEEKFARAFQSSPALMALSHIDDGRIIDVNAAFVHTLGYARDELIGHTSLELGLFARPAQRDEMVQTVRRAGSLRDFEIEVRTKHGDLRHGLFSAEIIHLQERPVLLTVMNDITARKQAETALHHMNSLLEQRVIERTRELTEANMHLTELDRLKDEFVSRISHELRTPIANIRLYLGLLEHGKPEKHTDYLQTLQRETARLNKLIEDLLAISQLDLGQADINRVPVDVNRLTAHLQPDWQAAADERGLTLAITPAESLPPALADLPLLTRAIANLMSNALNYTPRGGHIWLMTAVRPRDEVDWVTITIADTGPGIGPDELPNLFERFYRGRAARNYKVPGTGLGLAMCKEILDKLGGAVTVESVEGHGAAFTLWLRLA